MSINSMGEALCGKYFSYGVDTALRDIDARLKNIESALRVPGLPTELRPGAVPNAIVELSERLSALEAAAEKAKKEDEEIERDWEALVKRLHAAPLQPNARPTAPPITRRVKMQKEAAASKRQPGWYLFWFDGKPYPWEWCGQRWQSLSGALVDRHGREEFAQRIQEPEE